MLISRSALLNIGIGIDLAAAVNAGKGAEVGVDVDVEIGVVNEICDVLAESIDIFDDLSILFFFPTFLMFVFFII